MLVEFDFKGGRESENQTGIGRWVWVRQLDRPGPWYVVFTRDGTHGVSFKFP